MTMTAKSNIAMREHLESVLGDSNPFSPKGLHYLACRMNGSVYHKPITIAIDAMVAGRLQELVPDVLKNKICKAFGYKDSVPDAALVIIGTGRRAVKGDKGWDEAGYSLLNVPPLPTNFDTLDKKQQDKFKQQNVLRTTQKVLCTELMEFLTCQAAIVPPKEKEPAKPKKVKDNVVKFKTKIVQEPEVVVTEEPKQPTTKPKAKKSSAKPKQTIVSQ